MARISIAKQALMLSGSFPASHDVSVCDSEREINVAARVLNRPVCAGFLNLNSVFAALRWGLKTVYPYRSQFCIDGD